MDELMSENLSIQSRDFWVKVVEVLQQNWALIEPEGGSVTVYFIHDLGGVFDQLTFDSLREAQAVLRSNGFRRYDELLTLAEIVQPPAEPFHRTQHPDGPIYSSGRFLEES
ncbi:MAG: hypothetical protein RIR25_888 [Verrucomicrobiota bacterium]